MQTDPAPIARSLFESKMSMKSITPMPQLRSPSVTPHPLSENTSRPRSLSASILESLESNNTPLASPVLDKRLDHFFKDHDSHQSDASLSVMDSTQTLLRASTWMEGIPVLYNRTFQIISLCILWYFCSSLSSATAKEALQHFPRPVTLTYVQFLCCALYPHLMKYSSIPSILKYKSLASRSLMFRIVLYTAMLCVSHVMSSLALNYAAVSFVHTVKGITPLFTVIVSRLFLGVKYTWPVYRALIPLTVGIILACFAETSLQWQGLFWSLTSALVIVIQNIFTKHLFKHGQLDQVTTLFWSSLFASLMMLPWCLWDLFAPVEKETVPASLTGTVILYLAANGLFYFLQALFALSVLSLVTPVGYSIASQTKRLIVIATSIAYFHEIVSWTKVWGVLLSLFGVFLYSITGHDKQRKKSILPLNSTQN